MSKKNKSHRYTNLKLLALTALGFFTLVSPQAAMAVCVAGIPCIVDATPDDPATPEFEANTSGPNASKSESAMCDADFMNQIYANATASAERNLIAASVLIRKPDSVLEYSCFDLQVARVEDAAGDILEGFSSGVNGLVLSAMNSYINSNFGHTYLLGDPGALDTDFSSSVGGVDGTCGDLYDVFQLSKCRDFADEVPYSSMHFISGEPGYLDGVELRNRPAACSDIHEITNDLIALANNESFQYASFDPTNSYLNTMNYAYDDIGNDCVREPIPTGIMFLYEEYSTDLAGNPVLDISYTYEDKFCPNPGCYFDNKDNDNPNDDTCER